MDGDSKIVVLIDISYHQSDIDFVKVKESGVYGVIIREGFRMTTDRRFFEYVQKAKEAGLVILGIYHFSYALNSSEAIEEAKICIGNLVRAELPKETVVFYDFEYDTIKKAAASGVILDKNDCNLHTVAFCETVESFGYEAGIYLNLDFYKNYYAKETLGNRMIWLADYTGGPDFNCSIQQYTSKGSVPGIKGNVDMNYLYVESLGDEKFKISNKKLYSRNAVVKLINSWIGKKESDGSYKEIIDIYNTLTNPPRGLKMQYSWAWCACTWSAIAIKLGYTEIIPIEISCGNLITIAKGMGIWKENDNYIPKPGDGILYDWDDTGVGDNIGWPDHIGIVTYINEKEGYIEVAEGNYSDSVKKRTISINGKYIRGFITPKYDLDDSYSDNSEIPSEIRKDDKTIAHEVIAGKWDTGQHRKKLLEDAGYSYSLIQLYVNEILNGSAPSVKNEEQNQNQPVSKKVIAACSAKSFDSKISGTYETTANLYCRNDAGTNKKALCRIPNGAKVKNYGYYTTSNGIKWLYIQVTIDGIQYTGFSSVNYLRKI